MNDVIETEPFSERLDLLEIAEREWIDKMKEQLRHNINVGKPLRYDWFREKKFRGKRLYFIVNEQTRKIILIAFNDKKEQQATIQRVLSQRALYQSLGR